MATFPTLQPVSRIYNFGAFPLSEAPSKSAGFIRFRHAEVATNYQLTLGYEALSDAEAALIRTHYGLQAGGYLSFPLPSVVWKGHTFSGNIAPATMQWRYASPPEEEHITRGVFNVTVDLLSDGTLDPSLATIDAALTAGKAGGGGSGSTLTVTSSISSGAGSGT